MFSHVKASGSTSFRVSDVRGFRVLGIPHFSVFVPRKGWEAGTGPKSQKT